MTPAGRNGTTPGSSLFLLGIGGPNQRLVGRDYCALHDGIDQTIRRVGRSVRRLRSHVEERAVTPTTDPLGDAITVLKHVKINDPSARPDIEDAHNRVNLALEYLRMEQGLRSEPRIFISPGSGHHG